MSWLLRLLVKVLLYPFRPVRREAIYAELAASAVEPANQSQESIGWVRALRETREELDCMNTLTRQITYGQRFSLKFVPRKSNGTVGEVDSPPVWEIVQGGVSVTLEPGHQANSELLAFVLAEDSMTCAVVPFSQDGQGIATFEVIVTGDADLDDEETRPVVATLSAEVHVIPQEATSAELEVSETEDIPQVE